MISAPADGGQVINYSDRFNVLGMTGSVAPNIKKAVTALGGSTAGPPTVNEVNNVAPVASVPADPGAGDYGVPYAQQKGPTKYAPMQKVPPTKITAKKVTPLNPTSAWTVAKTWLPKPTVISTVTEPNTFSVRSRANTAAPQSNPTGDMQKFLARWKD
ncbi:Cell wall synthesis protein kre9 precursor [Vermiconidia calcicola]|uniref:Cell wall synthesis protein kre9 n=1 Tax=Vermiconidia calcicola TaxID=1690605 RepID=A0ACC3MSU5_9PEZI|nr:Cell wall synthesis protein kre9 precursor [Vermiconidia calcicola]